MRFEVFQDPITNKVTAYKDNAVEFESISNDKLEGDDLLEYALKFWFNKKNETIPGV